MKIFLINTKKSSLFYSEKIVPKLILIFIKEIKIKKYFEFHINLKMHTYPASKKGKISIPQILDKECMEGV